MKGALVAGMGLALVLCAGTGRAGYIVDGDGDGVADEVDQCLYTPRGATVGKNGCSTPGDEDEDGVPEAMDACPQTPIGAIVDRNGCAIDSDVDGIADGLDRCPGTTPGAVVTANGCRKGEKPRVTLAKHVPPPPPRVVAATGVLPSAAIPASPSVRIPPPPPPRAVVAAPAVVAAAPPVPEPSATRSPAKVSVVPLQAPANDGERYLSIQFAPGQSELSAEWRQLLARQAASLNAVLAQRPATQLVVVGFADPASDGHAAEGLAARRSGVVREALASMAVPAARMTARTRGARDPQYSGAEAARNRRVDLGFLDITPVAPGRAAGPGLAK